MGVLSCGRGHSWFSGETTYEHLGGKVAVELIRKTDWSGGKFGLPQSRFSVRVHTEPPFDEPTVCERVELAEDQSGMNVAFRCSGTTEWDVLRLRGNGRHIRECQPPVGTSAKPDFAALRSLVDIAPKLLDCAESSESSQYFLKFTRSAEVVTSVREEAGSGAAIALVLSAVARSAAFDLSRKEDSWEAMFAALTMSERASALPKVCENLVHEDTEPLAYLHALRWCSLGNEEVLGSVALVRLQRWLHKSKEEPVLSSYLDWIARLASRAHPTAAGEIACASGKSLFVGFGNPAAKLLVTLIARARIHCSALVAAPRQVPCARRGFDCDGGLCPAAELTNELAAWARDLNEVDDAGARNLRFEESLDDDRVVLAAAYAQGPLPREILIPNARRLYEISDAEPPCENSELAEDTPCRWSPGETLCTVPIDTHEVLMNSCKIRIDDVHRKLEAVHRCSHDQSPCRDVSCCPGLKCSKTYPQKCEAMRRDGG